MSSPLFSAGDKVQSRRDPGKIGRIDSLGPVHAGIQYYEVFWGGVDGQRTVPEVDLREYRPAAAPSENLINHNLAGYPEFLRLITYQRLLRENPLSNNLYAFNASRTKLYPFQFKPVMKFIESPGHRVLICDEVGLGKTIEAGLVLTEFRSRQVVQRVLVVCPANLCPKWKRELKTRFDENFRILSVREFLEYLDEYEQGPERAAINGIISLEAVRSDRVLERLDGLSPSFDMVIVDEAHHMRNLRAKQRRAGAMLSASANSMAMLTATPVHLGAENLYSLLNILDDEEFPSYEVADQRLQQNAPIVSAQTCLGQLPPRISQARKILLRAGPYSSIKKNPLYDQILDGLARLGKTPFDLHSDRLELLKLQRDLSDLNLLSHIFTRTRRREVQEDFAERRAHSIDVVLSAVEKNFYSTVTQFVKAESELRGHNELIIKWRLNMPQRRVASSIPAMVDYYRSKLGLAEDDSSEDETSLEYEEDDSGSPSVDLTTARDELRNVVARWPHDYEDSKYKELHRILRALQEQHSRGKIIVFAFFKDTLRYLLTRLQNDGFAVFLLTGDTPYDNRPSVIEDFKRSSELSILLSSRVGSEGLDFQFCDTLVNYDLPWNPMEVEQRIGRLDRIGQESPVINIYNLWMVDTIEERILRRLYDRIHVFERTIGQLEPILGEFHKLERDLFSKTLTRQEEERRLQQTLLIIESRTQELERLESKAAQFIGTDQFFEEEIAAIKDRRRYVSGEQIRRFVMNFIRYHCPQTRLTYDFQTRVGTLYVDEELHTLFSRHGLVAEASRILSAQKRGLEVTFHSDVAFANPRVEFINVVHPLITVIRQEYDGTIDKATNAQHVRLRTPRIARGLYFYFIYRLSVSAARPWNSIEFYLIDSDNQQPCDPDVAEGILGEMLEQGLPPEGIAIVFDPKLAGGAASLAQELFLETLNRLRQDVERNNNAFVDRRLESLNATYSKNINKQLSQLQKAEAADKPEHYTRMLKGTIKRLRRELEQKQEELEQRRKVSIEYNEIAAGVLEVV